MNPLAAELNETLSKVSPVVYELLSDLGKELFFPKGILSQSAEAKQKAHKFNATIGTATEKGGPMYLGLSKNYFNLPANEVYPYAPPRGRPELRKRWAEKQYKDNPSMEGKVFSTPLVTHALTHGLSIVSDLFLGKGDVVVSPDKYWGNYNLTFKTRREAEIETFELFNEQGGFNLEAFAAKLSEVGAAKGKAMVLLNFPNNPTGYTPTVAEGAGIVKIVKEEAEKGTKLIILTDDAYFGLFYEDTLKQSLFGDFADLHENVLAIKLDGATKEYYAWGFRTGFITYGHISQNADLYEALEKKTAGIIRGTISNCVHSSQSVIERMLDADDFDSYCAEKFEIMKARGNKVKEVLDSAEYKDVLTYYPFNSGYFMCLKVKQDAEELRVHLLDKYGVGTISAGKHDLRIAFSCLEVEEIEEMFSLIKQAVLDMEG